VKERRRRTGGKVSTRDWEVVGREGEEKRWGGRGREGQDERGQRERRGKGRETAEERNEEREEDVNAPAASLAPLAQTEKIAVKGAYTSAKTNTAARLLANPQARSAVTPEHTPSVKIVHGRERSEDQPMTIEPTEAAKLTRETTTVGMIVEVERERVYVGR
jgi:hypothetical protein